MTKFICPLCKESLTEKNKTLVCKNSHSYDLSKYGYVNLMLSQKSSKKRHGDDKLMLNARHNFLNKGCYKPLLNTLQECVLSIANGRDITILDVGCGEGYYTSNIHKSLPAGGVYGIDISKDALICAAKRDRELSLAVSSCAEIPMADKSCDIVLNIFSPTFSEEYARVLNDDGYLIKAVPLENHLFELKKKLYENPYKNKTENIALNGFSVADFRTIKYMLTLDNNEDIMNLFKMTPYYYKTSREDQAKLSKAKMLETEIEFGIILYKK